MRVHFISIGGAVMHNLAIALHKKGYTVSGSDDHIEDPSRSRLAACGLLPEKEGWHPEVLTKEIDLIVLGMHARGDNPELKKAKELGLKIQSFPEFLYEQTKNKKRVVIGGSHGKTTITSMVMHVLKGTNRKFDYMVGSSLDGFDDMVSLNPDSGIAIFEGDEYLTSALDKRPKFLLYKPHIAVISGIAWDHANVFPEKEDYFRQFELFIDSVAEGGKLIYCSEDKPLCTLIEKRKYHPELISYNTHGYFQNRKGFFAATHERIVPMQVFGGHNMQNLNAAREVCLALGIDEEVFYRHMQNFTGAGRRLECIAEGSHTVVYQDFAHAPSKVKATIEAVAERYPSRRIHAVLELHTFSSLNTDFIPEYLSSAEAADQLIVYFNPEAVKRKELPVLSEEDIQKAFGHSNIQVITDVQKLRNAVGSLERENSVFLFMSSASFGGIDMQKLAGEICPSA